MKLQQPESINPPVTTNLQFSASLRSMEAFRDDFLSLLCNILITHNSSCQSKLGLADSISAPNHLGWRSSYIVRSFLCRGAELERLRFTLRGHRRPSTFKILTATVLLPSLCNASQPNGHAPGFQALSRDPQKLSEHGRLCRLFAQCLLEAQAWALTALQYKQQLLKTT